jgi:hypothetical protein
LVQGKARTFSPGDRIAINIGFTCEGGGEIESVEAVFAKRGSREEIMLLGDARMQPSGDDERAVYTARLEAMVDPGTTPGEYRCARLSARDRFDDDWGFTDPAGLDLVIRVEPAPHWLEVTASDFI